MGDPGKGAFSNTGERQRNAQDGGKGVPKSSAVGPESNTPHWGKGTFIGGTSRKK